MADRFVVGTRGSSLALAQTKLVLEKLGAVGKGVEFDVVPIKTAGDLYAPSATGVDGKTAFTGEIERQLIEGHIDVAVHSMKDLPAKLDDRLVVAATPERGDPRDALVSRSGLTLSELKKGGRVGTSSARRKAQLLATRRDLDVVELHGNVETRLLKIEREGLDGVVLAAAGLDRLGLGPRITQLFATEEMVPAPCQGILAVQARRDSREMCDLLGKIDHRHTRTASDCERAFSEALGGDCFIPLGAYASQGPGGLTATGLLADADGSTMVKSSAVGDTGDARGLGRKLAAKVIESGGREILERIRR